MGYIFAQGTTPTQACPSGATVTPIATGFMRVLITWSERNSEPRQGIWVVVNRPAIAISSISRFERVHTMMNSNNNLRYRHFGRGFSLIEMMIAILIGIILSIGLVQVMVAGKTAAQATQGANFMQEMRATRSCN